LTVADIRATNPTLWNDWKGSLLRELYINTQKVLRRGLQSSTQDDDIKEMQYQARQELRARGLSDEKIDNVWHTISRDYFSRFSVEDSIWHTLAISSCSKDELPLVLLRPQSSRGGAEIFIYVNDRSGMFAVCTATLDQLNLNILDARIISTHEGIALISFHVLENHGTPIPDLSREQLIANVLRKNLINPEQAVLTVDRHKSRQAKHFEIETLVKFKEDHNRRYTILEIETQDEPGVLSTIGQCFSACNVNVRNAKIATIGSQAVDVFYLTDDEGKMIEDVIVLEQLKHLLIEELSGN
jgi:[protein-PII] uridylyltransferase